MDGIDVSDMNLEEEGRESFPWVEYEYLLMSDCPSVQNPMKANWWNEAFST